MTTSIHRRVEAARRGENPNVVARLASGWCVLADAQNLAGYCILLADPVVETLNDLDPTARGRFLLDMAGIGGALLSVTGAARINYMILGNLDRALHAHVIPRFADEPPEFATDGPWRYHPPAPQRSFEPARDAGLMRRLAEALEERGLVQKS